MLQTFDIPFDENQVLDAVFGKSKDTRWHETISEFDLLTFPLKTTTKPTKILIKDFEKIDF